MSVKEKESPVFIDEEVEKYEFTALTRCDGCSARAYTRVYKEGDEWLFCGHHYNKHLAKFAELGYFIDNQLSILENELKAYNNRASDSDF